MGRCSLCPGMLPCHGPMSYYTGLSIDEGNVAKWMGLNERHAGRESADLTSMPDINSAISHR